MSAPDVPGFVSAEEALCHARGPLVIDPERQRALAAEMFPREWAVASQVAHSRRRHNRLKSLRERAIRAVALQPLQAEGKSCASCANFSKAPAGLSIVHVCDADSDFHGYAEAKPDGLCVWFRVRTS